MVVREIYCSVFLAFQKRKWAIKAQCKQNDVVIINISPETRYDQLLITDSLGHLDIQIYKTTCTVCFSLSKDTYNICFTVVYTKNEVNVQCTCI